MRAARLGWKWGEEGGEPSWPQGVSTLSSSSGGKGPRREHARSGRLADVPSHSPQKSLLSANANTSAMLGVKHESLWNCVLWQSLMILPFTAAGTFCHWSCLGKKLKWSPPSYHISPLELEILNLLQRSKQKSQNFWKPDLDFCQL